MLQDLQYIYIYCGVSQTLINPPPHLPLPSLASSPHPPFPPTSPPPGKCCTHMTFQKMKERARGARVGPCETRISGWDELDQNFKNVGRNVGRVGPEFQVVRGVLIQAHCPGCETRGSLQTPVFRGRPTRPAISK